MKQYLDTLKTILEKGRSKEDRTGTGTTSYFGTQMRFDLNDGFPLVTTKKVHLKSIIHELLWILSGNTNIEYLQNNGVSIWNEWATDTGELGPVYGHQLRSWPGEVLYINNEQVIQKVSNKEEIIVNTCLGDYNSPGKIEQKSIDQIQILMDNLCKDPFSRRHVISMWNPAVLPDVSISPKENAINGKQALPPCHLLFQMYCDEATIWERATMGGDAQFNGKYNNLRGQNKEFIHAEFDKENIPRLRLSCQLYMRSMDFFLGTPFNIASYALLNHMVAQQLGYAVGDFILSGGDCHIYNNHIEQVKLQLTREPYPLPKLVIKRKPDSIFDYKFEDFEIVNYQSHPHIAGKVAV